MRRRWAGESVCGETLRRYRNGRKLSLQQRTEGSLAHRWLFCPSKNHRAARSLRALPHLVLALPPNSPKYCNAENMLHRRAWFAGCLLVACSSVEDTRVTPTVGLDEPTQLETRPPPMFLDAPEDPMAAGSWVDRTPCPAPISQGLGLESLLTFDVTGRLFALGTSPNSEALATLWRWDESLHAFLPNMPCRPGATWPSFQYGLFAYDPVRQGFLAVGQAMGVTSGENAGLDLLYTMASDSSEWTAEVVHAPWQTRDYQRQKLVLDEMRGKVVVPILPLIERLDDSEEWVSVPYEFDLGGTEPFVPFETSASAYDPVRGLVVGVGGEDGLYTTFESEVGGTWLNHTSVGQELDVRQPKLWWDPVAERVSLVGFGDSGSVVVWGWDNEARSWQALDSSSTQRPTAYTIDDFAVDPTTGNVVCTITVLHGAMGRDETQLWRFEPEHGEWIRLSAERWPTLWPENAISASAYDTTRRRLIVVTATENVRVQLTEWDGTSEVFVDRTSGAGTPWPENLLDVDVAYDSDRGRLMLLGDTSDGRELWEWNPETGEWRQPGPTLPQTSLTPWPPKGVEASVVYDWAHRRLAVWVGELLTWDANTGLWERHSRPDFHGSGRAALVADSQRGCLVLIRAEGTGIAEWDGREWRVVSTTEVTDVGPGLLATYDERSGRTLMLFTATRFDEPSRAYLNARNVLLSWDGKELRDITPRALADVQLHTSTARSMGTLTYDTRRGNLVLVGPIATANPLDSSYVLHVWEGSVEGD